MEIIQSLWRLCPCNCVSVDSSNNTAASVHYTAFSNKNTARNSHGNISHEEQEEGNHLATTKKTGVYLTHVFEDEVHSSSFHVDEVSKS